MTENIHGPGVTLPPDLEADIETYEREVKSHLAGDLPAAVLKAKRVPRGVYEQRRDGSFMVRVRIAGGVVRAAQARELAALSREYGDGFLHVTTRQDVQLHEVAIADTPAVMRRLLAVGLTSKGGGGNTVRNVMACPLAGICASEAFDVTPCAHAVTEYLIAQVGSYHLPRKYKIAFSGCAADCALAGVADLGFVAKQREGRPGFKVMAGGGMGAQSRIADPLLEWIPAAEILRVAETVRRLFDRLGDRRNKHRARLRYVFDRLGVAAFREKFQAEYQTVIADGVPEWDAEPILRDTTGEPPSAREDSRAGRDPAPPAASWLEGVRIIEQRQHGVVAVPLHLPLGFLSAADFDRIAGLATRFSREAGFRTTRTQDLMLRFVRPADLPALADALRALETDMLKPDPLDRFVACAGAATCRLGICLSRDAARACAGALNDEALKRATLDAMTVHINGCTNSCGQQPIAPLGLFGAAQRVDGRLIPSYGITLGGRCDAGGARFGELAGKVPARAVAACVRDLAADFQARRTAGESFTAYVLRTGMAHFKTLVTRHADLPAFETAPAFYRDLGSDELFSLAGRGAGECGAGVFEVIEQDLKEAQKAQKPFDILLPSARALLITRGIDAREPDTIFREFERHFIDRGLVDGSFRNLLTRARGFLQGWRAALDECAPEVMALRDRVNLLFSTLDANLEFHPPESTGSADPATEAGNASPAASPAGTAAASDTPTQTIDLRGVACPMNFVRAKLKLEPMARGDTLAILLDDGEPIRNVPASFKNEGQHVESTHDLHDGHWRVVIRKKR